MYNISPLIYILLPLTVLKTTNLKFNVTLWTKKRNFFDKIYNSRGPQNE